MWLCGLAVDCMYVGDGTCEVQIYRHQGSLYQIFVLRSEGYIGVGVASVCQDAETGMFGAFEELKKVVAGADRPSKGEVLDVVRKDGGDHIKKSVFYPRSYGKPFVCFLPGT